MIHTIRQQYLHVELTGTESDGLAMQRSLPDLCHNRLTPAIEQVLERYTPTDGHLYIECLEIDVGTVKLERLDQDLAGSVAQALEKLLREKIPSAEASLKTTAGDIQYKTTHQTVEEAFLYFLKTGSLPWSFRLPEGSGLEQAVLDAWQEAAESGVSPRFLQDRILPALASPTVRQRLLRQFSLLLLETLLLLLSSRDREVMDEVTKVVDRSSLPSVETDNFKNQLWETVFAQVATGSALSKISLVREAWRNLPVTVARSVALANVLERHWPGTTRKVSPLVSPLRIATDPTDNTEPIPPDSAEPILSNHPEPFSPDDIKPILPDPSRVAKLSNDIAQHSVATEGIYIGNAGLVLLHPFLPRFFSALDIAAEDELLQPERALCLLHFLTTGQTILMPEYELVLPKVLCNIPLATPVESRLQPSEPEQEEAMALLEAVIRHWEVLRSTSPDGLRGTFLSRPGKVSLRDDGDWLLQVEENSFDILLDQLPWGISMIKLPWMERILWVEWR